VIKHADREITSHYVPKSKSLFNWWSVSQCVLASSPFWVLWHDFNVLSDHYRFSHHETSSLMRGWICLLLVVLYQLSLRPLIIPGLTEQIMPCLSYSVL